MKKPNDESKEYLPQKFARRQDESKYKFATLIVHTQKRKRKGRRKKNEKYKTEKFRFFLY
jgi:hypothetical protein